jgi:hypothetical protein
LRSADEAEGKGGRHTAVSVAQLSRSSTRFAGAEVRLTTKVAALPEVSEALQTGAISVGQLDAVTTIATHETQTETISSLTSCRTSISNESLQCAEESCSKFLEN